MGTQWQRIKIPLKSEKLDEDETLEVADAVIDFIAKRSRKGYDMDGDRFVSYTKDYAKKTGKNRRSVDLTMSKEMLDAIKILSVNKNGDVWIGYERGSDENAKADGNQRGTYGQPKPIPGKARPFLGIRDDELAKIIDKVVG
jgi:hypothetical protein